MRHGARLARWRQRGVALLVTVLMLIAVVLVGASAARLALQGEKAARGDRDRQIAFEAAEEGLMDAERDIEGGLFAARSVLFLAGSALGFDDGCGDGRIDNLGLCGRGEDPAAPAWQRVDLAGDAAGARSVEYGSFTGASMRTGEGALPFKRPRYVIERLPYHRPGEEVGAAPAYVYRVTAIGFGARPGTEVVLQSVYRKPD